MKEQRQEEEEEKKIKDYEKDYVNEQRQGYRFKPFCNNI